MFGFLSRVTVPFKRFAQSWDAPGQNVGVGVDESRGGPRKAVHG
jgi:hypothetical protein